MESYSEIKDIEAIPLLKTEFKLHLDLNINNLKTCIV
jgi:hypothetical protein